MANQKRAPRKPHSILLVENSDDDARRFERALARLDGQFKLVSRVSDGAAAIAYLKGEGEFADRQRFAFPDIMVLDLELPGCDGFQVLEWAQRRFPRPLIAVFTSSDGEPTRRRAEQLGADLYETKIWHGPTFDRFLHFAGNMALVKNSKS
jgi:CheY-like chemotaxis protein